jgi:hypothetical protein
MALLCDDVMATGEDAFSNGISGGNRALDLGSDSPGNAGADDDGDDDDEDEDDEGERGLFGNISVCPANILILNLGRINYFIRIPLHLP